MTYPPGDDIHQKYFSKLFDTWPFLLIFFGGSGPLLPHSSRLSNSHTSVSYICIYVSRRTDFFRARVSDLLLNEKRLRRENLRKNHSKNYRVHSSLFRVSSFDSFIKEVQLVVQFVLPPFRNELSVHAEFLQCRLHFRK